MKIRYHALPVVTLALGCAAPLSRNPTRPEPVSEPIAASVSTRTVWVLSPDSRPYRYHSSTETLLELSDPAASESINTAVDFSLSVSRNSNGISYSATLESISVQGGPKTGSAPAVPQLPLSLKGELREGRLTAEIESSQPAPVMNCSTEALSAASAVQRALLQIPASLRKDMTWTDSTTAILCSGSIPVNTTILHEYRVTGETGRGILIERQDRTVSSGQGIQDQHRIRLRTEGSGSTQLIIDSVSGGLVESNGTHTASVTVTASGKDQKFTQTTREQTRRLN
jgi:hypothetical protein